MSGEARTPGKPVTGRNDAISALEARLASTPRTPGSRDRARAAYRLGLAYAESTGGEPAENLRKALASYDIAAGILDPRLEPVEYGRVLNAVGAARRALGERTRAAALFEAAADLLDDPGRAAEQAAALNNLGLVRSELGDTARAVAAFNRALEQFDPASEEGRRGRAATLHNRGQAHAALGTRSSLEAALADYSAAAATVGADDAPYHGALVSQSIGVAYTALAASTNREKETYVDRAIAAFKEALVVFDRNVFPFQYALTKHNLGRAYLRRDDINYQRRALACFEDAVAVLDPRLHRDAWQRAYASFTEAERALDAWTPGTSRAEHFASLLAECEASERAMLARERLVRLLVLPEPRRDALLIELAVAEAKLDEPTTVRELIEAELNILMELPNDALEAALRARVEAHRRLGGRVAMAADHALDQAIGDALGGPQRVFVRDFLYSLDWERP